MKYSTLRRLHAVFSVIARLAAIVAMELSMLFLLALG